MRVCRIGVDSPTTQLKAQLVAVESETPFTLTARGMISGGCGKRVSLLYAILARGLTYNHGMGPQEKPNAALYATTQMTTAVGVIVVSRYIQYPMSIKKKAISIAPEITIIRLPQISTRYHGGIVEAM